MCLPELRRRAQLGRREPAARAQGDGAAQTPGAASSAPKPPGLERRCCPPRPSWGTSALGMRSTSAPRAWRSCPGGLREFRHHLRLILALLRSRSRFRKLPGRKIYDRSAMGASCASRHAPDASAPAPPPGSSSYPRGRNGLYQRIVCPGCSNAWPWCWGEPALRKGVLQREGEVIHVGAGAFDESA